MSVKEVRERKIMILMYLILFFAGAFIGAVCCYQILTYFNNGFHIAVVVMCHIAAALLCGGILSLSSMPLRAAFHGFSNFIRKRFRAVKVVDVAGIVIGILVGVLFAFLTEFLFRLFFNIIGVRIIIDVIIGLFIGFLSGIAISGWLSAEKNKTNEPEAAGQFKGFKGYLLTESAFTKAKTVDLCRRWIDGNIYVLSSTVKNLEEQNNENTSGLSAYSNFLSLYNSRTLKILEFDAQSDVLGIYLEAAKSKKLKIIAAGEEAAELKKSPFCVVLTVE